MVQIQDVVAQVQQQVFQEALLLTQAAVEEEKVQYHQLQHLVCHKVVQAEAVTEVIKLLRPQQAQLIVVAVAEVQAQVQVNLQVHTLEKLVAQEL